MEVLYDETPLPKSPFQVAISDGCDPTRVVAEGPGLEQALTDKPNKFSIITRCHTLLFAMTLLLEPNLKQHFKRFLMLNNL